MNSFTETVKHIAHEFAFWQEFVKTPRFLIGWAAKVRTPELHNEVYDFFQERQRGNSITLDVGSGVVSILNGTAYNLTAADPLAELYKCCFDYKKYGIEPCVSWAAEDLPYVNQFDFVHCSNAIDHCVSPIEAYKKLRRAVKPGGYLIIQGFENEGEYEKYEGFHQWNLSIEHRETTEYNGPALRIQSKHGANDYICNPLYNYVKQLEGGKTWFIWIEQV